MTPEERREALNRTINRLTDSGWFLVESWLAEKDAAIKALDKERNRIARESADVFDELTAITLERDDALRKAAESERLVYGFMEGVSDGNLESRMNAAERAVDHLLADERRRTAEEIARRLHEMYDNATGTARDAHIGPKDIDRITGEVGGSNDQQ